VTAITVIARSEATKQSSAREARKLKAQHLQRRRSLFAAPAGARLDCFASLAMTKNNKDPSCQGT
jgi:hypothetical protein